MQGRMVGPKCMLIELSAGSRQCGTKEKLPTKRGKGCAHGDWKLDHAGVNRRRRNRGWDRSNDRCHDKGRPNRYSHVFENVLVAGAVAARRTCSSTHYRRGYLQNQAARVLCDFFNASASVSVQHGCHVW